MKWTLNAFFRSRIECVLNNEKIPVLKGMFLHQRYMVFALFFLILFWQNRKFYGTAIVYHAQYFCERFFKTFFIGILQVK